MTTHIDSFGRTRITLSSDRVKGKTIEMSRANWARAGYPVTAEEAFAGIAQMQMEAAPCYSPFVFVYEECDGRE